MPLQLRNQILQILNICVTHTVKIPMVCSKLIELLATIHFSHAVNILHVFAETVNLPFLVKKLNSALCTFLPL
jgi:hypothetical protein